MMPSKSRLPALLIGCCCSIILVAQPYNTANAFQQTALYSQHSSVRQLQQDAPRVAAIQPQGNRAATVLLQAEKEPQQEVDEADELLASLERGGDLLKSTGGDIIKWISQNELLAALLDASGQVAKDVFSVMRRSAANTLTASLPQDEREELLERTLGQERVQAARKFSKSQFSDFDDDDDDDETTMSVNENVAAAAVKDQQRRKKADATKKSKDSAQWEQEKQEIYEQAEQAAKERVETELAIQKQRMDQEKRKYVVDAKAALEGLSQQRMALEKLQNDILEEKKALVAEGEQPEGGATTTTTTAKDDDQTEKIQAMEVALREKEELALQDQQKIEALAKKLEAASKTVATAAAVAATVTAKEQVDEKEKQPRIAARRYSPEEYRNLTDDEKAEVKALREKEGPPSAADESTPASSTTDADSDVHPILGPVLQDLGYKRIHMLSVGKLGTIPIWKKQRIYRHERARSMVNDKWKSMNLGLPGIICLHEEEDGKLAIVDGQHRVGMMMMLRDKQRKALMENDDEYGDAEDTSSEDNSIIDFDRVLVEVYPYRETNSETHAQDLFLEINKAEPVQLVDMPGVAKSKDRKLITEAVDELYDLYPNMFSPSQRCRVPNVNVDNMRNNLFGSDVVKTHKLTTTKKLVAWVLEQNDIMAKKYQTDEDSQGAINTKAWKKASGNGFYLGLDSSWLYK